MGENVIYKRAKFNFRVQNQKENIVEFVNYLQRLVLSCDYSILKDDMIWDRIVVGILDSSLSRVIIVRVQPNFRACNN